MCNTMATVDYRTVPQQQGRERLRLVIPLCGSHLRGLFRRCLSPSIFHRLCGEVAELGVNPDSIFLLHDSFYDAKGRALQPVVEPW
ncbi:MAG: hypothetical protein Q7R81_00560 [Candidatus Peregrinibacteria bacterium]|nr:hypothetical protein [Candidatus Peregrinibacteria bacterium]